MKIYALLIAFVFLVGCVEESDLDNLENKIQKSIGDKMSAVDRINTLHNLPVEFEIHDFKRDGDKITAAIRSVDSRIKGKSIYLDVLLVIHSGDVLVAETSEFFYLNDGIGKIDSTYYISSDKKRLIQPDKGVQLSFRVRGWGEMYPGNIVVK